MPPADPTFWNNIAEQYATKPVDNPEAFERKIAITQARITPDSVVLDIGCGTGSLALRLAGGALQVHGLDLSDAMVRIARGKAAAAQTPNARFHVGPFDPSFDVFPDGSLDGVCAYSLLHLVDDPGAAVAHIYRLLKPGGFFIASTVCLGESWVPMAPMLTLLRWAGKAPMVKVLRKQALHDALRDAGFVQVAEREVGASRTTSFLEATKPR